MSHGVVERVKRTRSMDDGDDGCGTTSQLIGRRKSTGRLGAVVRRQLSTNSRTLWRVELRQKPVCMERTERGDGVGGECM